MKDLPMNSQFDSFTHFAKNSIVFAQEEMGKLGESQIQSQHLLLGILRQPKSLAGTILKSFGVSYENAYRIAVELKNPATVNNEKDPATGANVLSIFAQKAIEASAQSALDLGHSMVDSEHILYALLHQKDSGAIHVLETLMVRPSHVLEYLNEPIEVLKEISRICRKDAKITLFVVHAKSYSALSQINYKINFTENSFDYRRFEQYSIPQFELIEKEFIFKHWWKRFIPCKKYLIKFFDGLYDCMRFEFKVKKEINKN